ncbi:ArsR/SmtB family transcription factor [Listeria fleischmannii]|jgi:ArsR family transcriptional regulator|uniref:Helix-turn-helix transcriptional regulator n=1 Tax=Listeria fleischmannii TaxID=1069827 RepID=A0A841YCR7_9LIST|nr:metalloregulator ArsR/SmtB family transcription factor [Listeria fleischmannii]EIA21326.1 ArsR family transcriptional regulator [Listeria fleischmannii subsp. coloradonensis]MBC1397999.1 helix-turn-helix transcriptional regulator [Listeria fleischmannii]MBC1417839.1 helix-turn-helix transcriptional regulator [Listeria fleischmannii]MBC1426060.1 helix-turn-helix transcriptional regulator [Listeria fleischmannii]
MKNLSEENLLIILQALADPIRLNIFRCLLKNGERSVSCGEYHIAKSTLSHHIKVLKEAELIELRKEGTTHFYSVNKARINEAPSFFECLK